MQDDTKSKKLSYFGGEVGEEEKNTSTVGFGDFPPSFLVGGFSPTHLKNMQPSNWIKNVPRDRGENSKKM